MKRLLIILPVIILLALLPAQQADAGSYNELQSGLLQGWNTWYNADVLTHVKMPEGLALSFKLRKQKGSPPWLHSALIGTEKRGLVEKVTPLYHSYDGSYTELILEWQGQKARIQSAHDGDDIVLLYTPLETPAKPYYLVLAAGFLWNKPGSVATVGGYLQASYSGGETRIGATEEALDAALGLPTPYLSFYSNQTVGFFSGRARSVAEIQVVLHRQKSAHAARIAAYGDLADAYEAMQTMLAWNTIYDAENGRALTPVSRMWNEDWGGYIIFDWDTYFTSLMLALDNPTLGYANALAMTRAITENGFVPNLEASHGVKTFDRSQPPVGSMIINMIFQRYGEKWLLEEAYPALLSWNHWWEKARDNRGYLSWGTGPHPQAIDPPNKQAAMYESGLDNSPLFDQADFNEQTLLLELGDVGLMSLYIADCRALAEIAETLGQSADVREINRRAQKYSAVLKTMWDQETGIFRDVYLPAKTFSPHLAPTQFYALLSGVPTQKQAGRMVAEHFFNPNEFYGDWMLPSIARNDPGYADNEYWRGRIWAPMNFLVYLGLRNYDLPNARRTLAEKSLNLMMQEWRAARRVYENYNADTGEGGDVQSANDFYSWGALLGMISLMEAGKW